MPSLSKRVKTPNESFLSSLSKVFSCLCIFWLTARSSFSLHSVCIMVQWPVCEPLKSHCLSSFFASFTITYNVCSVCVGVEVGIYGGVMWCECMHVSVCENLSKNRVKGGECVCVVCLMLSLLISLAVWPRPEILVRQFWITARDLSAAGEPREIWGS